MLDVNGVTFYSMCNIQKYLDISLENLLISDVFVMSDSMNGQQQIYLSHNFQIRFCDFGLATAFDGKDFRCNKYVGKTGIRLCPYQIIYVCDRMIICIIAKYRLINM